MRDDIRSFCQITYTITSWRAVAGYITCANQVVIDLFPQDSPQVQKQITDISPVVSSSSFNMPCGNSSNTFVQALLEVEESFNKFCNHLKLPLMGCCNLIPQEQRCLQALIVTVLLGSNHSPQFPPVTLVSLFSPNTPLRIGFYSFIPEFGPSVSTGVTNRLALYLTWHWVAS